nr:MAG TPA: hypothetical protein [Caudoviricetes sp.]
MSGSWLQSESGGVWCSCGLVLRQSERRWQCWRCVPQLEQWGV